MQLTALQKTLFNLYFSGEGLTYTLSNNSGFKLSNVPWGPGTITGTILSTTSSTFNQNPQIQSFQYYALSQTNNEYQIYGSVISDTVSFSNLIATINSGNCYVINTINDLIVVTCLNNNQLTYMVYNTEGVLQNTFPLPKINPYPNATFSTQTQQQLIATLINEGVIVNGAYNSTNTSLNIFQFNGITAPTQLKIQITLANESDFVTGFSLQENYVIVTTFYTQEHLYFLSQKNDVNLFQSSNPFETGLLGLSKVMLYDAQYLQY